MNKLFEIDENEKRRILEMHENATKNLYLMEQPTQQTNTQQPQIGLPTLTTTDLLNKFINFGPSASVPDRIKYLGTKGYPGTESLVNNTGFSKVLTNGVYNALTNLAKNLPSRFYNPETKQITAIGYSHILPIEGERDILDNIVLTSRINEDEAKKLFKDVILKVANDQLSRV